MQKEFVSICGEQVGEDMSLLETRAGVSFMSNYNLF